MKQFKQYIAESLSISIDDINQEILEKLGSAGFDNNVYSEKNIDWPLEIGYHLHGTTFKFTILVKQTNIALTTQDEKYQLAPHKWEIDASNKESVLDAIIRIIEEKTIKFLKKFPWIGNHFEKFISKHLEILNDIPDLIDEIVDFPVSREMQEYIIRHVPQKISSLKEIDSDLREKYKSIFNLKKMGMFR